MVRTMIDNKNVVVAEEAAKKYDVNCNLTEIKNIWTDILAKEGYTQIEEDATATGEWAPNEPFRQLAKVAFWKNKEEENGVIVWGLDYPISAKHHPRVTAISLVGDACDYLSIFEHKNQADPAKVTVNGNEYYNFEFRSTDTLYKEFTSYLKEGKIIRPIMNILREATSIAKGEVL